MFDITLGSTPRIYIEAKRVMLVVKPVSMRKGVAGLMAEVVLAGMNPVQRDTLWLFCAQRKRMLKGLMFRPTGFITITKTAGDGHFQWPSEQDVPEKIKEISPEQFKQLLDGYGIVPTIRALKCPEEDEE